MTATYVYVITDRTGWALYVGHTIDLFRRLREHGRASWAADAHHVTAEVFADKSEALELERNYIADLEPVHNAQGWSELTDDDLLRAAFNDYAADEMRSEVAA